MELRARGECLNVEVMSYVVSRLFLKASNSIYLINAPRAGQAGFTLRTRGRLFVLESSCNNTFCAPVLVVLYRLPSIVLSPTNQLYSIARETYPSLTGDVPSTYVQVKRKGKDGGDG